MYHNKRLLVKDIKMQNYIKTNYDWLRKALWDDIVDRTLFLVTVVLFVLDYALWSKYLKSPDIFIYLRVNLYPVKLLAIFLTLNDLFSPDPRMARTTPSKT